MENVGLRLLNFFCLLSCSSLGGGGGAALGMPHASVHFEQNR